MTALDELTKDTNWDYEEQCMDGAPLGYAEVYYIGDPVFAQAKLELAALREAGEKMAEAIKTFNNVTDIEGQDEEQYLYDQFQTLTRADFYNLFASLAKWEAANK